MTVAKIKKGSAGVKVKRIKSGKLYQALLDRILPPRRSIPVFIFCYHKVGTILLGKVFRELCKAFDWRFATFAGEVDHIPKRADVVLFQHSIVSHKLLKGAYNGLHFIRDPRDIIVSGYLYHKRCHEKWCVNTNFDSSPPILFPRVPLSQQHRPEHWKREYLRSLCGKSYQQNLKEMTQSDGLLFEMNHYGRWTINQMMQWDYPNPNILTVRFEDLMADYDSTFAGLFSFCGFSDKQKAIALQIAAKEDLNRKTDEEIQADSHISSRQTTKWREFFNDEHIHLFKELFGNAAVRLGYEDFER